MNKIKTILAIATIGFVGTSLTSAQSATQTIPQGMNWTNKLSKIFNHPGIKNKVKNGENKMKAMGEMRGNRPNHLKINEIILTGDYATFQTQASTTVFAKLDQNSFNSLKASMLLKKQAEDQIKATLQAAGITFPTLPKKN